MTDETMKDLASATKLASETMSRVHDLLCRGIAEGEKPERPEKAPEGYELTGEFRIPNRGEFFVAGATPKALSHPIALCQDGTLQESRWILRKTPTVRDVYGKDLAELTPPDNREFTGEF
ncbi:MAG: hypothetical protein ABFD86_13505, partial [Bryobacteraceae bacterium]